MIRNDHMASAVVQYLQLLIKQKGSDLHFASSSSPMIRLHGDLVKIDIPPMKASEVEALVLEILSPPQKERLQKNRSVDFSIRVPGLGGFRVNAFFQRHGLAAAFRALPDQIPSIEELRLPAITKSLCSFPNGLILVTGPTGSGKSTTLAAMIHYINQNMRGHILTLEDPIEFQHESQRCMVNQRELGSHFTDFNTALSASLREDPDVILVGEMRDPETIALAITAAETGHLVFATLHTNSASKSIDRILDSFPGDQQPQIRSMLSESLRAVISQKLVPTADHKGRIAVHDILVNTSAVANLIREGKTFQIPSAMQTGRQAGMQVMDQTLLEHARSGAIQGIDAWEYANDKNMFANFAPRELAVGTVAGATSAGVSAAGIPKRKIG